MNIRRQIQKSLIFLQRFLSRRIILVLTLLFCLGATLTLVNVWRLSDNIIQAQALQNAELSAQMIRKARTLYSDHVVSRAKKIKGIFPTHNYEHIEGGIPLPATFLLEFGDRISENQRGMLVRLYSDYPFPWRKETGGAKDQFEAEALVALRQNPEQPFYRVETFQDRLTMRYTEADILQASCIECHNTHPDTPKNDWKIGDVRGVVEIVQPLDNFVGKTRSNLTNLLGLLITLFLLGLTGLILAIRRLNNNSKTLELRVIERTKDLQNANYQLAQEQEKTDSLLLNILPETIAEQLKNGNEHIAEGFGEVTILFADIVGFTELSHNYSPRDLVTLLNEIFSAFDHLTGRYQLEKIKTIGDAYMVASGLPNPRPDHAEAIAAMALAMQAELRRLNQENQINISLRIGINSGPVVAGVIGKKKFIYDLWGDSVNMASRMESHGLPDSIQITESTYRLIKDHYECIKRGEIEVKGKGKMTTYFLLAHKPNLSPENSPMPVA